MMASNHGRIHVLGLGNLGLLYAHALAKLTPTPPPITLLLHRRNLLKDWDSAGHRIEITTNGISDISNSYEVEDLTTQPRSEEMIEHLIVTTKTIKTRQAVESVKHRLGSNSTLLFCQNGMGTIDEVASLFPNQDNRPNFLAAITKHGVYSTGPFRSVHAGVADVTIGHVQSSGTPSPRSRYLMDKIVESTILAASEVPSKELLYLQLEKLAINSVINPLTTLFRLRNGEILEHTQMVKFMEVLLDDTSKVLQALPEIGDVGKRFSKEELLSKTVDSSKRTAGNSSSMLQDSRAGRETEIDYINGWIVGKGKEHNINSANNERLVDLVKEGNILKIENFDQYFSFTEDNAG